MLGPDKAFDTNKYLVVCANVIGSCYGTCGPTSINPMTGRPYSGDFPLVTVRDSVGLHSRLLVEHLGVREVFAVVGGSMGGMQALEWTFIQDPPVNAAVALACNGKHNAWQIGFSGTPRHSAAAAQLNGVRSPLGLTVGFCSGGVFACAQSVSARPSWPTRSS